MKTICIYHANCFDGMAAAWIVKKAFPDAELIPAHYGDKQLEITLLQDCYENANINDQYIIVDFSLPRDLMILMNNKAIRMLVLDHHKTAQANCEGLEFCVFDMEKSGAGLAWDYFFPSQPRPNLINYIEDRDLWRFKLYDSEAINACIQSYEMNIENYNYLHQLAEEDLQFMRMQGLAIQRYKDSMVKAMCDNAVLRYVAGYLVPTVNATLLFSEIGHELCQREYEYPDPNGHPSDTYKAKPPFVASFFIRKDGKVQYSLRSIGDFDVSSVAKSMGGGGHKNAAGFETEMEEF